MRAVRQQWPDEFAARYRERGYWRGDTFGEWLRARAEATPDRRAVVAPASSWTYAELDARADALAAGFRRIGLEPGDRAVVQLPNIPEFISVVFGLFRAQVVPVFALPAHRRTEIAQFALASEASTYIVVDRAAGVDYRDLAEEVLPIAPSLRQVVVIGDAGRFTDLRGVEAEHPSGSPLSPLSAPQPSSVALMQLSGGSTGVSKLIPRTHDDYIYSVRASAEICGLGDDTVYLGVLPIAHNFPMSSPGFLGTLWAGGTVVLSPSPSPDVAFPLIARERVTFTALVPPLALVWMDAASKAEHDLSSLEVVQIGGAKLTPEVARRVRPVLGATLQQVFGMAEGLVNYTRLDDPDDVIVTTQGRPISPDDEVLIVDDEGRASPEGETGHLLTRGPYTIRAYHHAPEANNRAFTADGFYRTGDIVRRTADGNLVVMGRATDQINRGGEKISPEEVEDQLVAHPQVFDAVVVSIPDQYLGERSCAFVLARAEPPKASALRAWVRSRGLASYKVPDQIVFIDAFPTTAVGKTSRKELRAALREQFRAGGA